jgi:RND family efflux transporter MFP subunit
MSARFFAYWFSTGLCISSLVTSGCEPTSAAPPVPVEVAVSAPIERPVTDYLEFTGRTEARDSVQLRARIGGYVEKVNFVEGGLVKEGQLLFQIDDRTYRAERDRRQAELKLAEARVKEALAEYNRNSKLRRDNAASEQELEEAQRTLLTTQATQKQVQAELAQAELNLDYTQVKAPFSGWADRANVTVGNLVSADTAHATVLTSIVVLEPMYVYFSVDQPTLLRLRKLVREGSLKSAKEKPPDVLLGVGEGPDYPFRGTIDFIPNRVDPATGTLTVRASFPNKDQFLKPGLFARIRVPVGEPHSAILVSDDSIGTNQGQKYVYIVTDKNEVAYRPVKPGGLSDGLRIIDEGLKPGERVINGEGILRVRPGITVVPTESKMVGTHVAGQSQTTNEATAPAATK